MYPTQSLNPPKLSSVSVCTQSPKHYRLTLLGKQIVEDNDYLQPNEKQISDALEKSRRYWYCLASFADIQRRQGLFPEYTQPCHILHRIPQFRGRPKKTQERPFGVSSDPVLCLEASSTWKLVTDSECDKLKKEVTNSTLLQIGISVPVPCTFHGRIFNHWIGTAEEDSSGPNYLGILTLGWCYVLSARFVELYGQDATMRYTSSETAWHNESLPVVIDVGEVDEDVAQWWSAILAQRKGWEGIVKQSSDRTFFTPWTVTRTCETSFAIKQTRHAPSSRDSPLLSSRAFEALVEFARLHQLGSQFPIALAIAMTIPMHKYYDSTVRLPPPKATGGKTSTTPDIPSTWVSTIEDISYYITLSCSPEVMMSALCGSFWEPDVPCNLVSPWLHPALNEVLDEASREHSQEILAVMAAIRRPSLGALWIGAVASGLGSTVLKKVKGGRPPLDPLAFPWTGCPQCFMDIAGYGRYTCENADYILRADVWRLLHLPSIEEDDLCYTYRPSTPWTPPGRSLTRNCALRVASHLECLRHEYQYDHWNWELADGVTIMDYGLSGSSSSIILKNGFSLFDGQELEMNEKKELDQTASREASLDVFRWFVMNGEGLPRESIYQDDWLQEIREEDDSDELNEGGDDSSHGFVSQSGSRVELWLNEI